MARFTSHSGGFSSRGAALTLAASGCWACGSLWARRLRLPADPVVALTTQLIAAATVLVTASPASGIAGQTDLTHLPAPAWWALGFLIIASTLVGYGVFLAVNTDVSPLIANTFNYASPVVANCSRYRRSWHTHIDPFFRMQQPNRVRPVYGNELGIRCVEGRQPPLPQGQARLEDRD